MKTNRWIIFLLWCLSLVGISFYGGAITYTFFWTMTLLPLLSLIYLLCVYWFFRIYQQIGSKILVCDQPVPFYFTLQNEIFFAFVGIKIHFFAPFSTVTGIDDGTEYELIPKTGIQKETTLICKYRGEYEVGVNRLEFTDFLRLFHISFKNAETLKVNVRPKLVRLNGLSHLELTSFSQQDTPQNPDEPDVLVREYVPGDDIRKINWRITAKTRQPMVRNLIGTEQQGITILMSTLRKSDNMLRYLPAENKVLELTLALALYYTNHQTPATVFYLNNGIREVKINDMPSFTSAYDLLSETCFWENCNEQLLAETMLTQDAVFHSRIVYMVLQDWDTKTYQLAKKLNQQQIPVLVYHILPESSTPKELPHPPLTTILPLSSEANLMEVL